MVQATAAHVRAEAKSIGCQCQQTHTTGKQAATNDGVQAVVSIYHTIINICSRSIEISFFKTMAYSTQNPNRKPGIGITRCAVGRS